MKLVVLSLYIQLGFSLAVLLFAISSLLINQIYGTGDDSFDKSTSYNLITFVLSAWFPSPLFQFLMNEGEDSHREDSHDTTTNHVYPVSSLRDLPKDSPSGGEKL